MKLRSNSAESGGRSLFGGGDDADEPEPPGLRGAARKAVLGVGVLALGYLVARRTRSTSSVEAAGEPGVDEPVGVSTGEETDETGADGPDAGTDVAAAEAGPGTETGDVGLPGEERSAEEIEQRFEEDVEEVPAEPGEMEVDEEIAEAVADDESGDPTGEAAEELAEDETDEE